MGELGCVLAQDLDVPDLLATGKLRASHDLTPDLLRRIQDALTASKVVPMEAGRILRAQGQS